MIFMHFPPGARGDFLGGFLLDCISERDSFAINQPTENYTKIHHTDNFSFLRSPGIKIRIDSNLNSTNLINIAVNHINKNIVEHPLDDPLDQHYMFIKDIINRDWAVYAHKDSYDYWIDFSKVNDYNLLWDLYVLINKTTPDERLLTLALNNIKKQTVLSDNYKKLANLLDFEIKFNLLDYHRSFDYNSFITSNDPTSLLKLSNYSREEFVQ